MCVLVAVQITFLLISEATLTVRSVGDVRCNLPVC